MELLRLSGEEALRLGPQLKRLYADAYAEPPYDRGPAEFDEFVVRLADQSATPGFVLVFASVGEEPVGFAYGLPFGRGRWWRGAERAAPRSIVDADKFAVIELVVGTAHRGQGLARLLMDALLAGRTEPYAILLARPEAPARSIYDRWGWRPVGTVRSYPHWPVNDALARRLAG